MTLRSPYSEQSPPSGNGFWLPTATDYDNMGVLPAHCVMQGGANRANHPTKASFAYIFRQILIVGYIVTAPGTGLFAVGFRIFYELECLSSKLMEEYLLGRLRISLVLPQKGRGTMAGGHATYAGTQFQAAVASWLAAHLLAAASPRALELDAGVTLTSVLLETAAPVDDILAETSHGGLCLINVKTNVPITGQPSSALDSVFEQFVRQWLQGKQAKGNRRWERPLDKGRDRLVLAVDVHKSSRLSQAGRSLLKRIRGWEKISHQIASKRNFHCLIPGLPS